MPATSRSTTSGHPPTAGANGLPSSALPMKRGWTARSSCESWPRWTRSDCGRRCGTSTGGGRRRCGSGSKRSSTLKPRDVASARRTGSSIRTQCCARCRSSLPSRGRARTLPATVVCRVRDGRAGGSAGTHVPPGKAHAPQGRRRRRLPSRESEPGEAPRPRGLPRLRQRDRRTASGSRPAGPRGEVVGRCAADGWGWMTGRAELERAR